MQTMRTLGDNMAWLLKKIQTGKIPLPEPEEPSGRISSGKRTAKSPDRTSGPFLVVSASVYGLKIK